MNTKNVPAIIMLIAGFVDCIFLIIGWGVKLVLDRFFNEKEPEEKPEDGSEKPESEEKTEESEEGPGEEQKN